MNNVFCVQCRTGESQRISTLYFDCYEDAMSFIYDLCVEGDYTLVMFKEI